ncbi:rhamnan synthesis F family protein [Treponema sp. TIM-1]|uniref:rhamnan synthesis F family protein n=1 Tax=Treponema sp. TIM-1 TaxID=2898417 RepID=UPI003980936B
MVISNSSLSSEQYNKLSEFSDEIVLRENKGFDFGAWKDAMLKDGWKNLSRYDNLTLMNDTCFGPVFDLGNVYLEMEEKDVDFWGLTNNKNDRFGMPKSRRPIPEHIQSYFICFNKKVVNSGIFQTFWENVRYENKLEKVIQNYETQFTQILIKAGFRYSVFLDKSRFPEIKSDLAVRRPDLCLKFRVPVLKIRSFLSFPCPGYIISLLRENTNYPVSIVFDYLNQIYDPNTMLFIQNKLISNAEKNINSFRNVKTAIHLHLYYTDILDKYMIFLNNTNVNFDLYITTDSPEKKDVVYNFLKGQTCFSKLKEIIIIKNQGGDIIPWLSIKDRLNHYDIVGHFHTKNLLDAEEWIGITWLNDLLNSLLYNINSIVNEFFINSNLGVVIPEVPYVFRGIFLLDFSRRLRNSMGALWNKLGCKKEINFEIIKSMVFPIGAMFWYRPVALTPLFNLKLSQDDIGHESTPDECMLHAVERLIVYIAWNEGYDYRIAIPPEDRNSNFVDVSAINKVINSLEYRIGKYILGLPKAVKSFVEN